ncbi:MAG: cadherin domain-containing protein, partial [Prochlorococcus sp.]
DLITAFDSGVSDADDLSNSITPHFSGTSEATATVELFANELSLGTTTAELNGNWLFSVANASALSDGNYAITAKATDISGNSSALSSALNIIVDSTAPSFTSGGAALAIDENSGINQLIYTATVVDATRIRTRLKADNRDDTSVFSFNPNSGEVTLNIVPNYEAKSNYTFTLVTADDAGNSNEQDVQMRILDINEAPTDLDLSLNSFDENLEPGSVIGALRSIDPDGSDTHRYKLVRGDGAENNNAFRVHEDQLEIKRSPDFETRSEFTIRLQTKDSEGLTYSKPIRLFVNDLPENSAPSDLQLSTLVFDENITAGSSIGFLTSTDLDSEDSHTYKLVQGIGDDDNGSFRVDSDQLEIKRSPDYETQSTYTVRIETKDVNGLAYSKSFRLSVNDLFENTAPSDLRLSTNSFEENISAGSPIAILTTTDPDSNDVHRYKLISGRGDADNNAFKVTDNQIQIKRSPDYEAKSDYRIRLQTKDTGGLTYAKAFLLSVADLDEDIIDRRPGNDPPSDLRLSASSFEENIAAGSPIAILTTTDPDSNEVHHYKLISGRGDADNNAFRVNDNQLEIKRSPDYETKSEYRIHLQTKDSGGLTYSSSFRLTVNDLVENIAPTDIRLSAISFDENIAAGSPVSTLSSTDFDADDRHSYELVSGRGDADNNEFRIKDDQLEIKTSPDYEAKSDYSIRLQTIDSDGLIYSKSYLLTVKDLVENTAPNDLLLSASSFEVNISSGAPVAILSTNDSDSNDTHSYKLISGRGAADNNSFRIQDDQLQIKASPDYETKSDYSIRLQTKDSGGLIYSKAFNLSVDDLEENIIDRPGNEAPIDLRLSTTSFDENIDKGSLIGLITSTDPDPDDTYHYEFAIGSGDNDNNAFRIDDDHLEIKRSPDYETKSDYRIRLQS